MARYGAVKQLVHDFFLPNSTVFSNVIQNSIKSKSIREGRSVHARIIKSRFSQEIFILNRLIDMYSKCDCIDDARKVFDKMSERNIFSWNALIAAFMRFGWIEEAIHLFDSMLTRDQCTWNSMISGFSQHDQFEESLEYFVRLHSEDFVLNIYSCSSALSACSGLRDFKMGIQIHASIIKSSFASNVHMGSALVDMYSKCGYVLEASKVFNEMYERNVVSWNSMITCYEQNGPAIEALKLFVTMMNCSVDHDEVTLASVVSACASLSAIREGLQIHTRVIKLDKFRDDLILGNALVDMYTKCSRIREARQIFDRMPVTNVISTTSIINGYAKSSEIIVAQTLFTKMTERNIVAWNALIAGYTQRGENEEAIKLFCQLKRECVCPTHYTFGNILNACSNLANLQLGRQVHVHVLKHGLRFKYGMESDIFVGNSLVDMYAKCGSIAEGFQAFKKMAERDRVSWNAMIVGFAQNGYAHESLDLFRRMSEVGEKPDHVTMIGVLCACSHVGLVKEGYMYFNSMKLEHDMVPLKDHYTCMVDLLGRAGRLEEAERFIEEMPMAPDSVIWSSLLASCKVHHNIEMGKRIAQKIFQLDPSNSGPYVLLSNLYAETGRWREVASIRKSMRERGIIKQPGCSWIELKKKSHVFMVKDKSHPQRKEIYRILKVLMGQMKLDGYNPEMGFELREE